MGPNRRRTNSENNNTNHQQQPPENQVPAQGHHGPSKPMKCCIPVDADCTAPDKFLYKEDIDGRRVDVVKVVCNNDHCNVDPWMHKECFESWEQSVLTYLKSCGRARSWSEKQRLQNLWTKRGYDLAFKACGCKCGKGHLRKDLDWIPPPPQRNNNPPQPIPIPAGQGKKKKSKQRPTLSVSAPVPHPNNNSGIQNHLEPKPSASRRESTDSAIGTSTPGSKSGSFDFGIGGPMSPRPRLNSVSSVASGSSGSCSSGTGPGTPPSVSPAPLALVQAQKLQRRNSKGDPVYFAERTRRDSGGIFSHRIDFSSFNKLPKHHLNSYHIKMEDEGPSGSSGSCNNDDTRNFILTTLLSARMNRVSCILCNSTLTIFDRYPLIDGTFFLSPQSHGSGSLEVNHSEEEETRSQYLSAVCMGCLEGWNTNLICRACKHRWDGSDLVIGSCYTYDIFAATPCCPDRLCCSQCKGLVMLPEQRPSFFSDYSQATQCPHCGSIDYHLAKRLPEIFEKLNATSTSH